MKNLKDLLTKIFLYKEPLDIYDFSLPEKLDKKTEPISLDAQDKKIYDSLSANIDYVKVKYNTLINSDIKLREFKLNIIDIEYNALLLFIDGMINSTSINDFILKSCKIKFSSVPLFIGISKGVSINRYQPIDDSFV